MQAVPALIDDNGVGAYIAAAIIILTPATDRITYNAAR
jgi:hypothetical protein